MTDLAPANGRYEIVQSPLLARRIFKLDKFTGRVWTLVVDKGNERKWEPMAVSDLPKSDTVAQPRFQIFMSAILAAHTLLLDSLTGRSWILTILDEKTGAAGRD